MSNFQQQLNSQLIETMVEPFEVTKNGAISIDHINDLLIKTSCFHLGEPSEPIPKNQHIEHATEPVHVADPVGNDAPSSSGPRTSRPLSDRPVPVVEPRRLVCVKLECMYTGIASTYDEEDNPETEEMMEVYLPDEFLTHKRGIICHKSCKKYAIDDCISFAKKNKIFPVTKAFVETVVAHFGRDTFKIKRSTGEIEDGWRFSIGSNTSYRLIDEADCDVPPRNEDDRKVLKITVCKGEISKGCRLDEIAYLNDFSYRLFRNLFSVLEASLHSYYEREYGEY